MKYGNRHQTAVDSGVSQAGERVADRFALVLPDQEVDALELRVGLDFLDAGESLFNHINGVGAGLLVDVDADRERTIEMAPVVESRFPHLDNSHISDAKVFTADAQGGFAFYDSFLLSIGEIGFQDDMESGDSNWIHSGSVDLWHLTSSRAHSGDNSWYCGVDASPAYVDNMDNVLELIPVRIGQDATLSFWCWYEFTTYGSDGLYVDVDDGSGWETLDYLGSGGALKPLNIGNDWLEYTYDLSHYPPGTPLTLRFRFVSDDADVAEGAYVDDVMIIGTEWSEGPGPAIPAVSQWGVATMALLLATAGAVCLRRRRKCLSPPGRVVSRNPIAP